MRSNSMRKLMMLVLAGCISSTALADNKQTIFSCRASDGQELSVRKVNGDYEFKYKETSFRSPIKEVLNNEESAVSGGSGFTTYSLELRNKGLKYIVGYILPRGNSKEIIEPGASISNIKTGDFIDIISCDPKKKIKLNFDVKSMRKEGFAA